MHATADTANLEDIVTTLTAFFDDAIIELSPDGLEVERITQNRNVYVEVEATSTAFSELGESGKQFAVGLEDVERNLRLLRQNDVETVRLAVDGDRLGLYGGPYTYTQRLKTKQTVRRRADRPSLDYESEVRLGGDKFTSAVSAGASVAETLVFETRADDGVFVVRGGEGDDQTMEVTYDDVTTDADERSVIESQYSTDILASIADITPDDSVVTVEFSQGSAAQIQTGLVDGAVRVQYIISPPTPAEQSPDTASAQPDSSPSMPD